MAQDIRCEPQRVKVIIFSTPQPKPGNDQDKKAKAKLEAAKKTVMRDTQREEIDVDLFHLEEHFMKKYEKKDIVREIGRTVAELPTILEKIGKDDPPIYECFVFVFLTYLSVEEGVEKIHFNDGAVPLDTIWEYVSKNPSMVGKPKVFLVQADDVRMFQLKQTQGCQKPRKLPTDADRLTIVSTVPGKLFVKENDRSPMIEAFVNVLKDNDTKDVKEKQDMLSLTVEMNNRMKIFITKAKVDRDNNPKMDPATLPLLMVTSTLTTLVYL